MKSLTHGIVRASIAGVIAAAGVIALLGYWSPGDSGISQANAAAVAAVEPGSARAHTSDTAAAVAAFRDLPNLSGGLRNEERSRVANLDYAAAVVDRASVRRTGVGLLLARRSDGDACLLGRFASSCFFAFRPGGVQLLTQEKRAFDSPEAPFVLMVDGLAADGVKSVRLSFADGTSTTATVNENVFQFTRQGARLSDLVGYAVDGAGYTWGQPGATTRVLVVPDG
jgi:hypothetical protein